MYGKGINWSLHSFLLYLVSGNDSDKTKYIAVPVCIIRPVSVIGLRASEEATSKMQNFILSSNFSTGEKLSKLV